MKTKAKTNIKNFLQFFLFFLLMGLTFYTIFRKNDLQEILTAVKNLHPFYLICAFACGLFFVCGEGFMIWYLLRPLKGESSEISSRKISLFSCFAYSFVGFFFSGITPSATGGQPAQLLLMKKDGLPLGSSTLTLMTVAVLYKFILVIIGLGILFVWKDGLALYLGSYMNLYYLGIFLNGILVFFLLLFMLHGVWMEKLLFQIEKLCIRIHLCKPSDTRKDTFHRLIADYQNTLHFFIHNKSRIVFMTVCTFLQRCSLFLLTYLIYRGLGITGHSPLLIMVLQASVYIAVDMLPLPGSQGISELMYHAVFLHIFSENYLAASMCITRGISFYFLLIIGAVVSLLRFAPKGKLFRKKILLRF